MQNNLVNADSVLWYEGRKDLVVRVISIVEGQIHSRFSG
jgi:hypothetical protein